MTDTGTVKHKRYIGKRKSPLYSRWISMKERCEKINNKSYKNYGERGIGVSKEWQEFDIFASDMGAPKRNETPERIDVNKGYCKENCRWATWKEQASNKRTNHFVTIDGTKKTLKQWSETVGIPYKTVFSRVSFGWSYAQALRLKKRKRRRLSYKNKYNVLINGETKPIIEWCGIMGIAYKTAIVRIKRGWDIKKAILTPTFNRGQKPKKPISEKRNNKIQSFHNGRKLKR